MAGELAAGLVRAARRDGMAEQLQSFAERTLQSARRTTRHAGWMAAAFALGGLAVLPFMWQGAPFLFLSAAILGTQAREAHTRAEYAQELVDAFHAANRA